MTERGNRAGAWPALEREGLAHLELLDLLGSPVYYGVGVPRGDGSPVLLVPGFLGSDDYLAIMRGWLRRIGYRPFVSGIPLCAGPFGGLLRQVVRRVDAIAASERQPVTLIGHSLGGILGCLAAQHRPDAISHVVTLGSAICEDPRGASHPAVVALGDLLGGGGGASRARVASDWMRDQFDGFPPDGVRLTCIYSRADTVVDWRACTGDGRGDAHEVPGTHSGLAWNAAVYRVVARRLGKSTARSHTVAQVA
jgi:pimeloyl-ACP methyl ester carboxylesterase